MEEKIFNEFLLIIDSHYTRDHLLGFYKIFLRGFILKNNELCRRHRVPVNDVESDRILHKQELLAIFTPFFVRGALFTALLEGLPKKVAEIYRHVLWYGSTSHEILEQKYDFQIVSGQGTGYNKTSIAPLMNFLCRKDEQKSWKPSIIYVYYFFFEPTVAAHLQSLVEAPPGYQPPAARKLKDTDAHNELVTNLLKSKAAEGTPGKLKQETPAPPPPVVEEEKVIFSETDLFIYYKGLNKSFLKTLNLLAYKVGTGTYLVSYESLFQNCREKKELDIQIEALRLLTDKKELPEVWEDFFKSTGQKTYKFAGLHTAYRIYKLPQDQELIQLIAKDEYLRHHVLKAENYHILVPIRELTNIRSYLKKLGFFIEFL